MMRRLIPIVIAIVPVVVVVVGMVIGMTLFVLLESLFCCRHQSLDLSFR